jgi:hypothetical protein
MVGFQQSIMSTEPPLTTAPPPAYVSAPPVRHRPIGVTILAILDIIVGIFIVISAIGFLVLAGYLSSVTIPPDIKQNLPQWFINFAPIAIGIAGVILLIIGLITFLIAWGFLRGRNWSRIVAIILLFISIIVTVINTIVAAIFTTGALIGLIISIIIPVLLIWYLTTPRVKAWFLPAYYAPKPYP